jgi:hypothetical protein
MAEHTKYKIYLSPSLQSDAYASGNTTERTQCEKIAKACAVCLDSVLIALPADEESDKVKKNETETETNDDRAKAFEVKIGAADTEDARIGESNNWKADIHIPIHTNAADDDIYGCPIVFSNYQKDKNTDDKYRLSKCIYTALKEVVGQHSKGGVKKNTSFPEIIQAKKLVSHCECEFHSSEKGALAIIGSYASMGRAIAQGICDYYSIKPNFPDRLEILLDEDITPTAAAPIKITVTTPEAYPDPAQNITLSTDVTLRNGNFSYSFELPKKEGFGYYYNRATFKNGVSKECGYTTFLVVNNTEIIQLDKVTLREDSIQEDSTTRVSGRFVLKDKLSNADLNKLKVADSIQFGVKTYVKKPDKSILYSYVIPHASNSICLRVNNYNIIINPYNKD